MENRFWYDNATDIHLLLELLSDKEVLTMVLACTIKRVAHSLLPIRSGRQIATALEVIIVCLYV
jgi:hypothetical protein